MTTPTMKRTGLMFFLIGLGLPVGAAAAAMDETATVVVVKVEGRHLRLLSSDTPLPLPEVVVDAAGRPVHDLALRVPVEVRLEGDGRGERLVVLERWRGTIAR